MVLLFRTEYGSRAMGMATEDSDHDIMEVWLEPSDAITGLSTYKAKHQSTAGNGRSGPDDTDTVRYGLRHWAGLAAKGNPTALTPLFTHYKNGDLTHLGSHVLRDPGIFISKDAGRQARGYAKAQFEALQGMRNKKTNRPELVHKHGYDTKFAYHALRTLMQGYELMVNGRIELPIPGYRRVLLQDIRAGKVPKADFVEMFTVWDRLMDVAMDKTDLPEHADLDKINQMLLTVYLEGWGIR